MNRLKILSVSLLGFGAIVSGYLLMRYFILIGGQIPDAIDVCRTVLGSSCDETLKSPLSIQLGIPLAGWGLVYYGVMIVLLGLGWAQGESFESEATTGAFLLSAIAAVASLVLGVMMLSRYAPFCGLCAVIHVTNIGLAFVIKPMSGKTVVESIVAAGAGINYLVGGKPADPIQAGWKLCGFITSVLVGIVIYQLVMIQTNHRKFETDQVVAVYELTRVEPVAVGEDDPRRGPQVAKVQLVVFSSFQCPGCKEFVPMMNQLLADYDGEIAVVFKHFPLSKQCNPKLTIDPHPQGCAAAMAAEAARQQGKFWKFHDSLFAVDRFVGDETLIQVAEAAGCDVERFKRDRESEATKKKVRADIELGNEREVNATPTVFLNGRRLKYLSLGTVQMLIRHELNKRATRNE